MTWVRDVVHVLRRIVLVEERISMVAERVAALANAYDDVNRRLARLEGKSELLERMGAARLKRLPPPR